MKRFTSFACGGCILLSAIACCYLFGIDHLLPFGVALLLLAPVWRWRPAWRQWSLLIPALALITLVTDAFCFRHRLALQFRTWSLFWDTESIDDIIRSPSGKTTAYIVGSHWLDSGYWAYLSDGHLFPRHAPIETTAADAFYPRDVQAGWDGPVFTAREQFISLAYDERDGQFLSYYGWSAGPSDGTRSREAFSNYITTLKSKGS